MNIMVRLSPGIIASTYRVLEYIEKYQIEKKTLVDRYPSIEGTKTVDIIDTAEKCKWIISKDTFLNISETGSIYGRQLSNETRRLMISDFIKFAHPTWASLIPRGRFECVSYLPLDVKVCFQNAQLLESPPSDDVVKWWDDQSSIVRGEVALNKLNLGRIAEKLSLEFEIQRTGVPAQWKAIESNLIGYDILSKSSSTDGKPLLIEVKSSTNTLDYADAIISRNEWETAMNSSNYVFHFWIIRDAQKHLAIIEPNEIMIHIPSDKGFGKWENSKIAFSAFYDRFERKDVFVGGVL